MISVIIPALNEEVGIVQTIKDYRAVLAEVGHKDVEFVVVDDSSTDGTAAAALDAGATVLSNPCNMGYGVSLKRAIRAAKHDTIIMTDADSTYPAEDIPKMLEQYEKGFGLVVAERTGNLVNDVHVKRPLRFALRWLVEFTTGRKIPDPNSGFRILSKSTILPHLDYLSDKFSFTTTMTIAYMSTQIPVCYVPVVYHKRVGQTTVSVMRDTLQTLQYIIQSILYYNPLKIFLVTSLIFSCFSLFVLSIGLIVGIDAAINVGGNGLIVSLVIFTLGLIAEQLRQLTRSAKKLDDSDAP